MSHHILSSLGISSYSFAIFSLCHLCCSLLLGITMGPPLTCLGDNGPKRCCRAKSAGSRGTRAPLCCGGPAMPSAGPMLRRALGTPARPQRHSHCPARDAARPRSVPARSPRSSGCRPAGPGLSPARLGPRLLPLAPLTQQPCPLRDAVPAHSPDGHLQAKASAGLSSPPAVQRLPPPSVSSRGAGGEPGPAGNAAAAAAAQQGPPGRAAPGEASLPLRAAPRSRPSARGT